MNLVDQAGKLTQAGLAVIGAAVIGGLIAGVLVNFVVGMMFTKRLPAPMLRWVRLLSGLASGIAVGLVVFSGTGGFGLGGGFGPGQGGAGTTTPTEKTTLTGGSATEGAPQRIGVSLLGGARVRGGAFYQLDGDAEPRTLAELESRLASSAGTLQLRIYDDSVSGDHAAVSDLIAMAERHGWKVVKQEFKGQTMPPEAKRT